MTLTFRYLFMTAMTVSIAMTLGACLGGKAKILETPTVGERISILSRNLQVKADPLLANQQIFLPTVQENADWPQSGGNPSKVMQHVALSEALTLRWSASIPGSNRRQRLAASPVVSDNRLFAVGIDATVYAFAADSGQRLWRVSIGSRTRDLRGNLFGGGAAVDGDVVYATSGVGDVAALNVVDGAVLWQVRPAGLLRGAPTVAFDGVYVMTQDNQIIALNATDGAVLWQASASQESGSIFGVGSPAAGQGTIVAGFSSGELQAYRYENGRGLWDDALARTSMALSVSTLTDVDADPVIDRGRIFALGQGGRMASYELLTGQRIWELSIAGISTPWIAGDWLYVLTYDAKILCVARTSGKIRWIEQLERYTKPGKREGTIRWVGPLLAGERLIIGNSLGLLLELSPLDGSIITKRRLSAGMTQSPIVANAMLYVLTDDGRITAWQ